MASTDKYRLGEGPVWDDERQRLLWVDINSSRVHTGFLRDGMVVPADQYDFGGTVGAVVCSAEGDLLVAGQRHVHYVGRDGARRTGVQVIPDEVASRMNDGGCDPQGRFLVGSMAQDGRQGSEILVRVEDDTVTTIDDDLTLSNGLCWSPDGNVMYSVDSTPRIVWQRSYDTDGSVGPRTEFLRLTDGLPDGLCADVDGNLWIAVWGAGQVRCYSPASEHLSTVEVPAPNTTSVAFVGPDLANLLITSARDELSADLRSKFPDSGRLFSADVGVVGAPVAPWRGI